MATRAYIIRSDYNPDTDRDRLLLETGQGEQLAQEIAARELWNRENLLTHRRAPPPRFVPATISFDEWGNMITGAGDEQPRRTGAGQKVEVASWYRSLPRSDSSPATSSIPPASASRSKPISTTTAQPAAKNSTRHAQNWFISGAISASTSSGPPAPVPSTSLADILARDPPSRSAPHTPPVFLHLGPDNRGWTMMQAQGWAEGDVLGPRRARAGLGSTPQQSSDRKGKGKAIFVKREDEYIRTENVLDDEEIVEVKHAPIIDLTLSDSSSEDENDNSFSLPPSPAPPAPQSASRSLSPDTDPDDPRIALQTPIATRLKADRLGIGLKAKTSGPYKQSVKRVTHNKAALQEHVRAAEHARKARETFGRGRNGLARKDRAEREKRDRLLAYMNS
ncbi:hypothetical protein PENSPDRAFT_648569 [Peniophora sp. CONT]|nr:hypothetical protein PENSPDRAFT_648569 [Peniophora sp. CONT]